MKNKYDVPNIKINKFSIEKVVTGSGFFTRALKLNEKNNAVDAEQTNIFGFNN